MADVHNIQRFLAKKGIEGPIFLIDPSTGTPLTDTDGSQLYLSNQNGVRQNGFYSVRAYVDDVKFTADITVNGWAPKRGVYSTGKIAFLLGVSPIVTFRYTVTNDDQVKDDTGTITTQGTFDRYFSKDVVKTAGNCEQWSAITMLLAMNGYSRFQTSFPVDFTVTETGTALFIQGNISQSVINTANGL